MPGSEDERGMFSDELVDVTSDGEEVWRWNAWEHLDPAEDRITAVQERRWEWTHGNAISELPNGDILIFDNGTHRLFEVTHDGLVVWEYINPFFSPQQPYNSIDRVYRYSHKEVERAMHPAARS